MASKERVGLFSTLRIVLAENGTCRNRPISMCLRLGDLLDAELSQVMVDVFVHENRPLLWFERTKERMWVFGAASCAGGEKAIDSSDELGASALEFALCGVRHEEFRRGG